MDYAKQRITLGMSIKDIVFALVEGNPGAIITCHELMQYGNMIDPDAALGGGFSSLLDLDVLGIYGERVYYLFSDVCGRDVEKVLALLRAYQLGQLAGVDEAALNHAIDNRGSGLDPEAALQAVKEKLPSFGVTYEAELAAQAGEPGLDLG